MYTYKVMIHPNNKQETRIRRTLNKCVLCNHIIIDYIDSFLAKGEKVPKISDVRKWFTLEKQRRDKEDLLKREGMTKKEQRDNHLDTLFCEVSNDALKQMVKDTYNAYVRWFKKLGGRPKKKTYKNIKKSFYVDPYKIEFTNRKVILEKISKTKKKSKSIMNEISLAERNRIPVGVKYNNPRVVLEGDRFYIVVGVDSEYAPKKKINQAQKDEILGIDMNINEIVASDNTRYESVTKLDNYKKAEAKLKYYQTKISKRYDNYKKHNVKFKTQNYFKVLNKKRIYQRRLINIQVDYFNQIINDLISKSYKTIHIEDLNVKEMKESYNKEKKESEDVSKVNTLGKKIASGLQAFPFRKFLNILTNRCNKHKIEVKEIDKYYPSSKMCSKCNNIYNELTLSDRIYKCKCCGLVIDRDLNAAINIARYKK